MKKIVIAVILLALSFPAWSIEFTFMQSSPVRYYTPQDWDIFKKISDEALEKLPNGKKKMWHNSQTNNGGYVQPLNTTLQNGNKCRNLKIFISAHYMTDQYTFTFCKINSKWKLT